MVAVGGFLALSQQNDIATDLVNVKNKRLLEIINFEQSVKTVYAGTYQLLAWSNASDSDAQIGDLADAIKAEAERLRTNAPEVMTLADEQTRDTEAAILETVRSFVGAIGQVLEMQAVDQSVATTMMIKSEGLYDQVRTKLASLRETKQLQMQDAAQSAQEIFHNSIYIVWRW